MLLSRLQRTPWQLACLLFATAATAAITPSNSSTAGSFVGTLPLKHADGDQAQIAEVIPLTQQARTFSVDGNLVYTNYNNRGNIKVGDIAYISCNQADYAGYDTPQGVFEGAYKVANFSGLILYSTATDYCDYDMEKGQQILQDFAIFSMNNKQASASLLETLGNLTAGSKLAIRVQGRNDGNATTGGPYSQPNPLGPSPSTAVAMIILYSITGIITALFLVIIITGAIRAHRHPERYGPRNVLGRPRQSRARGLGRAILDTIPIVKFGEKEPAKPTDVELASTAESSRGLDAPATQTENAVQGANGTPKAEETADPTRAAPVDEHHEGIAPAQPIMASAASGNDTSSHDENLGCSICTEDFEKGQDLRVLPCDHKFHPECVDPWLLNVSGTCPLCRVDLRPVTSHDSSNPDPDADPTDPSPDSTTDLPHRSAFRDILSLRHRPNATPAERIYYLRRLREQRRNRSGDVAEQAEDANDRRRSKRMSMRLSGVFGGRARRERSPPQQQQGESSRSAGVHREEEPEGNERRA